MILMIVRQIIYIYETVELYNFIRERFSFLDKTLYKLAPDAVIPVSVH